MGLTSVKFRFDRALMLSVSIKIAELFMLVKPSVQARPSLHAAQREHRAQRGWKRIDAAMQRPRSYRHPAGRIQRIETPISVIYLAGRYAYKLKKPVNPGFVDFTAPATRLRACYDEVRLNRRLARGLYLGVAAIVQRGRVLTLGTRGKVVEHAVRMKRFDEADVYSRLLERGELGFAQMDALAGRLATFHRSSPRNPPRAQLGSAALARTQMEDVLAALERAAGSLVPAAVRRWCCREAARLAAHVDARRAGGFVRECHGDLHLDNIVRRGNEAVMFDCIEFSDALRWIDVANDLAFTVMDLQTHGRDDLAAALLNGWLQRTGDFDALPALRFYIVYRALVRALVEVLKARGSLAAGSLAPARARAYVACAVRAVNAPHPYLLLCHGYSGSGKSVASKALAAHVGAIRLSSDNERKRVHRFAPPAPVTLPANAYTRQAIDAHYDKLRRMTRSVLELGLPALVDATFLKQRHRASFIDLASALSVPVFLLDFHASPRRVAERVRKRSADPGHPSDAGPAVLVRQLANEEPLTPDEAALTVRFDTDVAVGDYEKRVYWRPLMQRLLLGARRAIAEVESAGV